MRGAPARLHREPTSASWLELRARALAVYSDRGATTATRRSPTARAALLPSEEAARIAKKAGQRGGSVITAHSDRAQKQPRAAPGSSPRAAKLV